MIVPYVFNNLVFLTCFVDFHQCTLFPLARSQESSPLRCCCWARHFKKSETASLLPYPKQKFYHWPDMFWGSSPPLLLCTVDVQYSSLTHLYSAALFKLYEYEQNNYRDSKLNSNLFALRFARGRGVCAGRKRSYYIQQQLATSYSSRPPTQSRASKQHEHIHTHTAELLPGQLLWKRRRKKMRKDPIWKQ